MQIGSLILAASIMAGLTALTVSTLEPGRWITSYKVDAVQAPMFDAMEQNMMNTIANGGCIRNPADTSMAFLMENQWLPSDFEERYSWAITTSYFTLGYGEIAKLSLTLTADSDEEAEKLKSAAQGIGSDWRFEPSARSLTIHRTVPFVRFEFDESHFDFATGCFIPPREG